MESFKKLNNIIGWSVFAIASFVYLSTIEQTVSFWDCGEYIATAYKLEVGHPPGAPLFQLLGRIFSLFAEPGTSQVAVAINIMSALCSSFTILFLFWTITAFGRRIFANNKDEDSFKMAAILAAGVVGALTYTFTDSFWFSAVEGEVYAMSSFFTAITFWCIIKWEEEADQPSSSRWLILIAYLIGLSIGVHLLSLLTIPAMGMIYYYKKYEYSKLGAIKAFVLSMAVLGTVQGIIIPSAVSLISTFELFFVNSIGLPFNSGTIIYFLTLSALIAFGLVYTKKHNKPLMNTLIVSFMMLLIGYSSFAVLVVRSNSNPPIDENNPEDAVGLLSYLKREQYGSWPIVYGQYFNAKLDSKKPYLDGNPTYAKDDKKGKYIIIDDRKKSIPNFSDKYKTFFPRIWSNTQSRHASGYKMWAGLKNTERTPTFSQNLKYFFNYQIGWSYLRYFMWNFAGRQNDYMNMDGNSMNGNWESGISFIDQMRLGTPSDTIAPDHLKNNKAKNHYYFLPLLLGLIGMLFHFKKQNQDAVVVLLFFLFTGVLIIIYLNVVPFQPRERDYAYVGSFYAFSIWIGLGLLGIYDFLKKKTSSKNSIAIATTISMLISPVLLASENWDDHDRSGRFTALEVAKNYLNSCAKNAILFTNGDNDTFPLWYAQEVEGIRTDIKVVNLSLFNTDWYIDQMKRASYDAAPIPSSLEHDDYRRGTRDYTLIQEKFKEYKDVDQVVKFINSNNPKAKLNTSAGLKNYCPTKKLKLKVDKEKAKGFVPNEYHNKIVDEVKWNLKGNGLYKNKLMVLDILANFNWDRPIYFAITVGRDNFMGLEKYFQLEGLAYRLVPYIANSSDGQTGEINTEIMYENLMNKFQWGGLNNSDLYFDETNTRMVMNYRNNYARLAENLFSKGDTSRAIQVIDKCLSEFPREVVNLTYFTIPIIDLYYKAGEIQKGDALYARMIDDYLTEYKYLAEFEKGSGLKQNFNICGQVLGSLTRLTQVHRRNDNTFTYYEEDNKFYRSKENLEKEEIQYTSYRINTFLDEYYALQ
ncbi:DUF2723 domain-containing protein [Flavobacteriales bacterium]|nr:DUF2723 domain-containing protein [Flavobacteriales bacterium]MDC1063748.1 DUF2723 domain-containing protein [Flavobacteriales bacterium]